MPQRPPRLQRSILIKAAGEQTYGQCCLGYESDTVVLPVTTVGLEEAVYIAAGMDFTAVLTARGEVFTAGAGSYWQLGLGCEDPSDHQLGVVPFPCHAVDIASGSNHLLIALEDSRVLACGHNRGYECGSADEGSLVVVPTPVLGVSGARRVFAGKSASFVLTTGGEVVSFGVNGHGELCRGASSERELPQRAAALCGIGVREISVGRGSGLALLEDGGVLAWGLLTDPVTLDSWLLDGSPWRVERCGVPIRMQFGGEMLRAVSASAGYAHYAVATEDGRLWLWGEGLAGQIAGAGEVVYSPACVDLPGGQRAVAVQCNSRCTFVSAASGQVYACGGEGGGHPFDSNVHELRRVPPVCFGEEGEGERAFCGAVVTGSCAEHAFYLRYPPCGVLRVGDAEIGEGDLDACLSDLGVAAESTVHLLRLPDAAAAPAEGRAAAAGSGGLQVHVNVSALGVEGLLCVELSPEATARDLAAAAAEQLRRTAQ
eukprot:TRINITY_DN8267_c0_g1_i1.p1 TRINITY_DN8267_c0_g1~~TRINITY_DN8267_c0_g1_i1.p1  ORF type:complete len:486 (+),score=118.30 TRINITY_DN8267_c0_g1_i1:72-1529(+)